MSRKIDADELKKHKTMLWDPALGFCECVLMEDIDNATEVDAAADENVGGNRIPYSARKEIYTHALFAFGQQAQMVVAIEELSEAQKELCKMMRGKGDMNHLAEEIADATIMLEQMRYFLGLNEQVCRIMDEKIQRLDDTLAKEVLMRNADHHPIICNPDPDK